MVTFPVVPGSHLFALTPQGSHQFAPTTSSSLNLRHDGFTIDRQTSTSTIHTDHPLATITGIQT